MSIEVYCKYELLFLKFPKFPQFHTIYFSYVKKDPSVLGSQFYWNATSYTDNGSARLRFVYLHWFNELVLGFKSTIVWMDCQWWVALLHAGHKTGLMNVHHGLSLMSQSLIIVCILCIFYY
jgi:hypothetical protein